MRLKPIFKPEAEQQEQRLDGLTCFITNLSHQSCSAKEVVGYYRSKNKVEEAFHEIKSHINLRPIHLTRTQRVQNHVTICILAYFLTSDIELGHLLDIFSFLMFFAKYPFSVIASHHYMV